MPFSRKNLTDYEKFIIFDKGTEKPFSGEYNEFYEDGTYICKNCGLPLYISNSKFNSNCGWPSFDDEIPGAVKRSEDKDGKRTEITCSYCEAHLGHVFIGESLTLKNIRHCVNSASLDFVKNSEKIQFNRAIFAAGCFWGVEYLFRKLNGVIDARVGYTGGKTANPSYDDVCYGFTGHVEAVEIIFDSFLIEYETLVKYFFEIHDFSQKNGQGPDIGEQYLSYIFYTDENQKSIAEKVISELESKNLFVSTKVKIASDFWVAENYHQRYYEKTGKKPYCHFKKDIF